VTALHPAFLVAGLVIGAVAAAASTRQPPRRRGLELGSAALVGGIVLCLATTVSLAATLGLVIAPLVGGALGVLVVRGADRAADRADRADRAIRGAWWIGAVGVETAFVYLSVPDTEAAVLVGGIVVASFVPWLLAGWRSAPLSLGLGIGALAGVSAAAGVAGAAGRWTPLGWIVPKLVLLAGLGVAGLVAWRTRPPITSEPAPPSP
jgi:hypothetical protein